MLEKEKFQILKLPLLSLVCSVIGIDGTEFFANDMAQSALGRREGACSAICRCH